MHAIARSWRGLASLDLHCEVSSRGHWTKRPGAPVRGGNVVVDGSWIKVASLFDEDWIEQGTPVTGSVDDALKSNRIEGRYPRILAEWFQRYTSV